MTDCPCPKCGKAFNMNDVPWTCPKCGRPARGTLETVPGVARLFFDEHGNAEYLGQTDLCWEAQEAVVAEDGRTMLVCPIGHDWPAVLNDAEGTGPTRSATDQHGKVDDAS